MITIAILLAALITLWILSVYIQKRRYLTVTVPKPKHVYPNDECYVCLQQI